MLNTHFEKAKTRVNQFKTNTLQTDEGQSWNVFGPFRKLFQTD